MLHSPILLSRNTTVITIFECKSHLFDPVSRARGDRKELMQENSVIDCDALQNVAAKRYLLLLRSLSRSSSLLSDRRYLSMEDKSFVKGIKGSYKL
jgi:hypothetical protein